MRRITLNDIRGISVAIAREIDDSPFLAAWTIEVEKGSRVYGYSWTVTLGRKSDGLHLVYRDASARGLHGQLSAVLSTLYNLSLTKES